jgi:hypothetical protein
MWTSGAELSCSGGGSSFTREEVFSGAGEDAGTGEAVWLVSGMSGRAGDTGLSTLGLALELEARSDAIGALRERNEQVNNQKEKYVRNIIGEESYPEAIGLCFFGMGTPIFCLLCV